jgi:hypothetical protein
MPCPKCQARYDRGMWGNLCSCTQSRDVPPTVLEYLDEIANAELGLSNWSVVDTLWRRLSKQDREFVAPENRCNWL